MDGIELHIPKISKHTVTHVPSTTQFMYRKMETATTRLNCNKLLPVMDYEVFRLLEAMLALLLILDVTDAKN